MSDAAPNDSPSSRTEVIATLAIVGGLAAIMIGRPIVRHFSKHPSPELCATIVDRYAEQIARANEQRPDQDRIQEDPERPKIIERCTTELTLAEAECASRSTYADEFERCMP